MRSFEPKSKHAANPIHSVSRAFCEVAACSVKTVCEHRAANEDRQSLSFDDSSCLNELQNWGELRSNSKLNHLHD